MKHLRSSIWMRTMICVVLLVATSSCGANRIGRLGHSDAIATGADKRLVYATDIDLDKNNRVIPRQIICSEPSPDIAMAVEKAFAGSTALQVTGQGVDVPVQGSLEQVMALSSSRVEAVAQMTERLATIQLLRDGLYRACEAYSNGAITDVTYGMMVSRYDDTMVTMLMAELAAGNFGRSLAAIGGKSGGNANAAKGAVDKLIEAQKTYEEKRVALEAAKAEKAQLDAKTDPAPSDEEKTAATKKVETAQKGFDDAKAALEKEQKQAGAVMTAAAESSAEATAIAAGSIGRRNDPNAPGDDDSSAISSVNKALVDMHRAYLYDINEDALVVACIQALGAGRPLGGDPIDCSGMTGADLTTCLTKTEEGKQADQVVRRTCLQMLVRSTQFASDLLQYKTEQRYEIEKIKELGRLVKDLPDSKTLLEHKADPMKRHQAPALPFSNNGSAVQYSYPVGEIQP